VITNKVEAWSVHFLVRL